MDGNLTNQAEQPASVRFDEVKNFSENSRAFLASLEKIDREMALILSDNWELLIAVVREGARDPGARTEFNSKVTSALDSLCSLTEQNGGD